jgi:hypothetical protein
VLSADLKRRIDTRRSPPVQAGRLG